MPVSSAVYPANLLWEPSHHIVGYWYADEPGSWQPPADLLAFLEDGEPPLLISLGAMSLGREDALQSASLFVEALRQTGLRAVIQGWQPALEQLDLPPEIFAAGSLPHSWLLPSCAGLVHHGGFGTTSAGLRAGIPALIIPHLVDQFYWGQRVFELGAGPQPIRRAKLDPQVLAERMAELAVNPEMRAAASRLGEQIRAEHGLENAVRLIEQTFH